ncbi:MAG: TerB family tellurite resistance protein [Desulfobulbaceae bacterium]|nr:MAG: TerB family tellurite resistance protein [Desulfobulbaceae bacterium]
MKNLIKSILGKADPREKSASHKDLDLPVALSVLLLEAAHVDGNCSEDEMKQLVDTLTAHYQVKPEDIQELIDEGYRRREGAVDLFEFTRFMNQNFSKEQKIEVMESVWRIIHADGQLEQHEDHFAHKLANLLRLTHKELIQAKIDARSSMDPSS